MGLLIHIVDDNRNFQRALEDLLVRIPGVLVVARSYRCADVLTHARENPAQLVLLDIGMPDGNGLDLIAPLRALKPVPEIVVLSLCEATSLPPSGTGQGTRFIAKTDIMTELIPLVEGMACKQHRRSTPQDTA